MWTEWKASLAAHKASGQSSEVNGIVTVWFTDGDRYEVTMWRGDVPHGVVTGGYTQEQNDADLAEYDALVEAGKFNQSVHAKTDYGVQLSAPAPRTGRELILTTHNFCDPTTWFCTSERVTEQVLTTSDDLTYATGEVIIDMTHGKTWDENAYSLDVEHGYELVVTSDDVAQVERIPFADSGGDYVANYLTGEITFDSSQNGKVVKATYSKMVDSTFKVVPDAGTRIDVERARARFSEDVVLNDDVVFEIWVYNPYDLPNKVKIKETVYKTISNFVDEAEEPSVSLPAIGGAKRGLASPMHSLPFRYGTIRPVSSASGVELRVRLRNDVPFGGSRALATFYCTVEVE